MMRTGRDALRWWLTAAAAGLLGVVVAVVTATAGASAGAATPAPVPCSSIGAGKHDCQFYPAGDGISGGAPVQASDGSRVGYLNHGTNWVTCQAVGATVTSGSYFNDWWGYTEADDGSRGWVDAVWASGGDNDGAFSGVPACAASTGLPPGGKAPSPSTTTTTATTAPRPPAPSTTPTVTTVTTITAPAPPTPAPTPTRPRVRHLRVAIEVRWHVVARRTRLIAVRFFHLPGRARVRVRVSCRGRRCGLRARGMSPRVARRTLVRAFAAGSVVRLRFTVAGYAPEVVQLRFRTGRGPAGAVVSR